MKINFEEKICVRCGVCVSESEFGGIIFKDSKIFIDESKPENWEEIFSICPTGAINIFQTSAYNGQKKFFKELSKMNIEEKLMNIDFSRFSKVQESLLQQINERRARDNEMLDLEELDYVAAAGNPNQQKYPPKKN